jgi:pyruvate/2-oxoglutarate dehydrogenase complex dihydrolipoamide dehydrogenase (E3) component
MPKFDAIVIGTGQSGPALARRLVVAGWKVAIIERKLFGGTCVNTGCTPTDTNRERPRCTRCTPRR